MDSQEYLKMLSETLSEMGMSSYANVKNFISKVLNYGDEEADKIIFLMKSHMQVKKK